MNWLARLKKIEIAPEPDATEPTKPIHEPENRGFVGFVAPDMAHTPKTGADLLAANDPEPEPAADPHAWRELVEAYHAHHFSCTVCISAGRGAMYGLRCGVGAVLWGIYASHEVLPPPHVKVLSRHSYYGYLQSLRKR